MNTIVSPSYLWAAIACAIIDGLLLITLRQASSVGDLLAIGIAMIVVSAFGLLSLRKAEGR